MKSLKIEGLFRFLKSLKILDYLVIIAFLLVAVFLFKFFHPQEQWINVGLYSQNLPVFSVESLHIGNFEKDPSGKRIAEITDLQIYEMPQDPISASSQEARKDVFLKVKLLAKINPRSREYEYKNKVIKIGSPIELYLNAVYLKGTLVEFAETDQKKISPTKILTLKIYDQWPWYAENLSIGKGEIVNGQKVLEVLSREVIPAETVTVTAGGQMLPARNPRKVDITLKVKLEVQNFAGDLFFGRSQKILVGEKLSFKVGQSQVEEAFITDIE